MVVDLILSYTLTYLNIYQEDLMHNTKRNINGIDGFTLKNIAIISMLINHIGYVFGQELISISIYWYVLTLWIGRLTFPILAYLLVEGFYYTKNIKSYILRLIIFWVASIYPYYLIFGSKEEGFHFFDIFHNVFFTLLVSLFLLVLCNKINNNVLELFVVFLFSGITYYSDWGFMGILMVYGFYKLSNPIYKKTIPVLYTALIFFVKSLPIYLDNPLSYPLSFLVSTLGVVLSIPLLLKYNGQRGYSSQWVKWSFYIFYPLHLLILHIIYVRVSF